MDIVQSKVTKTLKTDHRQCIYFCVISCGVVDNELNSKYVCVMLRLYIRNITVLILYTFQEKDVVAISCRSVASSLKRNWMDDLRATVPPIVK